MSSPPTRDTDPVYLNARRESFWIMGIWVVFAVWCLGYSLTHGYANPIAPEDPVRTVLGFPHWVFWGVAVPWGFASIATLYFSLRTMTDDPLESAEANATATLAPSEDESAR